MLNRRESYLIDMDGAVGEVVVDEDLSDSVVLVGVFDDMLLEVGGESEDGAVVLEPGGLDARNVVILWRLSRAVGESRRRFESHGVEEVGVVLLVDEVGLLLHSSINVCELLGLVVTLLVGV